MLCGSSRPLWRFSRKVEAVPSEARRSSHDSPSSRKRRMPLIDPGVWDWLEPAKRPKTTPPPKTTMKCLACRGRHRAHTCGRRAHEQRAYKVYQESMREQELIEDEWIAEEDTPPRHYRQTVQHRRPGASRSVGGADGASDAPLAVRRQLELDRRLAMRLQRAEENRGGRARAPRRDVDRRRAQQGGGQGHARSQRAGTSSSAARSHEDSSVFVPDAAAIAEWRAYFATQAANRERQAAASASPTNGGSSAGDEACEVGACCMVCTESRELLLCRGYREASECDGRATDGHVLCRSCVERWHVAKNELLEANGELPRSRRECPVCKTELRSSTNMRADSDHCLGLRKLLHTWREAGGGGDGDGDGDGGEAEADDAEPDVADSDAAEPDDAEPDVAEPDDADADEAEPEDAEPDGSEPGAAEPGGAEPADAERDEAEQDGLASAELRRLASNASRAVQPPVVPLEVSDRVRVWWRAQKYYDGVVVEVMPLLSGKKTNNIGQRVRVHYSEGVTGTYEHEVADLYRIVLLGRDSAMRDAAASPVGGASSGLGRGKRSGSRAYSPV